MGIIEKNIGAIHDLCRQHHVSKLFIFGSAITNEFNEKSDVDFVVDFDSVPLMEYADNYFDLKFALEKIFRREVDLLEEKGIKNPYLKRSIDSSKKLVYG